MFQAPTNAGGIGLHPQTIRGLVRIKGGTYSAGALLKLDFANSEASNNKVGDADSGFATAVTLGSAADQKYGVMVILEKGGGDGDVVPAIMRGTVNALLGTDAVITGQPLIADPGNDDYLVSTSDATTTGVKIVGHYAPLDGAAFSLVGTASLARVFFDGAHGFNVEIL